MSGAGPGPVRGFEFEVEKHGGDASGVLVAIAFAVFAFGIGIVAGGKLDYGDNHRQGVIDATRGTWAADQHEVTGAWSVWKVERKEGEDGE